MLWVHSKTGWLPFLCLSMAACVKVGGKDSRVSQPVKSSVCLSRAVSFSPWTLVFWGSAKMLLCTFQWSVFEGKAKGCSLSLNAVLTQVGLKRYFSYLRLSWVGLLLLEWAMVFAHSRTVHITNQTLQGILSESNLPLLGPECYLCIV